MYIWRRVVKLFSVARVQHATETENSEENPSSPPPPPLPLPLPLSTSPDPPQNLDDASDTSSNNSDTDTGDTLTDTSLSSSNSVSVSTPKPKKKKTKSASLGRNSGNISKKTLKELKEKYRTSPDGPIKSRLNNSYTPNNSNNSNNSNSSNNSNNNSNNTPTPNPDEDITPDPEPPPIKPRKKHRSRSAGSHRSGSLRKAVLMQEEVKHLMTLDDVRVFDNEGNSPLHRVALIGNFEAVAMLCKKAPDLVNRSNKTGMTAMHYAGNANCVNVLGWWGGGINTKNHSGKTPVFCAVERGTDVGTVEALLARGAKINNKSYDDGWTPLHVAAQKEQLRIVELLLAWHADVNVKDKRLVTPLHVCASVVSRDSEEICRRLLNKKAKINVPNNTGATPLHIAGGAGNLEVLNLLLQKMCGSFPDAIYLADYKGFTPFHYAAHGGHVECVEALRRELPVVEQWVDDLGLHYQTWALIRGHFVPEFYPEEMPPFSADFGNLVNEESTSDVVFVVEGRPVFAHKILCYTSPYLANLIEALSPLYTTDPGSPRGRESPTAKMSIEVTGLVSHKIFVELLDFIYSGRLPTTPDWTQFWHASVKLELARLQQICEREIADRSSTTLSRTPLPTPTSPLPTPTLIYVTTPTDHNRPPLMPSFPLPPIEFPPTPHEETIHTSQDSLPHPSPSSSPPLAQRPMGTTKGSVRRKGSVMTRLRVSTRPHTDFVHDQSSALLKFVNNSMFHDVLLVCGDELVYAHRLILQKRSPNFFFVFAKNVLSVSAGNSSSRNPELILHFDDISKNAMVGLLEFIYSGCFHSKLEPEEVWIMYNFVLRYGVTCHDLKERAGYLFYSTLTPDNLLDLFSLNLHGFAMNSTITLSSLETTRGESPSLSPRDATPPTKDGDPPPADKPNRGSTYFDIATAANVARNTIYYDSNFNKNSPTSQDSSSSRSTQSSPNTSQSTLISPSPALHSPHHTLTLLILKYASKKVVLQYALRHRKKSPSPSPPFSSSSPSKLLQQLLRKHKGELEGEDFTKLVWKERQKEVKAFKRKKKAEEQNELKMSRSSSSVGNRARRKSSP